MRIPVIEPEMETINMKEENDTACWKDIRKGGNRSPIFKFSSCSSNISRLFITDNMTINVRRPSY